MGGILQTLESIDTAKLTLHLQSANGTVSVSGSASLGALDPRDLLGDLGALIKSGKALPTDPQSLVKSVAKEIEELSKLVDFPAAGAIADVAAAFDRLIKLLEQILEQIGGDPSALIDKLLGGTGGLEKIAEDIMTRMVKSLPLDLPGELKSVLQAVTSLARGTPANAQELAQTLSQILIGLDLPALIAPAAHVDAFLGQIGKAGGDFGLVHNEMGNLTTQVRAVSAKLLEPDVDVAAVTGSLGQIKGSLDVFINSTLAGAIARLTKDLAALDPDGAAQKLRDLLQPFESRVPGVVFDIEQDMVKPLRSLAAIVDKLTPEDLTARFEAFVNGLKDNFKDTGMEDMLQSIDGIFDMIVEEIQRVPLRKLRQDLLDAMAGIESRIRAFPGFSMPQVLAEQVRSIEDAIKKIDTASIQKKVDEFTAAINKSLDAFPIGEIKTEIEGLIGAVRGALDQFKPILRDLGKQIDVLAKEVEGIDFSQAGAASIDLMKSIRENVQQAIGSGDLPEPAKAAIGVAAGALKGLNVKVEISKPFDEALATLDPKAVLAPIEPVMDKIREVIQKVTPQALIDQLDKPFQQLLDSLNKLKPAALLAGLSADFAAFMDLAGKLDPRALIAPLEAEFQKIVKALRAAADPAPLFAPLRAAYQKLQDLLNLLDLEKVFTNMLGKLSELPKAMQESMQGVIAKNVPAGGQPRDVPPRELKFGDVIRPIAAMIARVRSAVARFAQQLVGDALKFLDAPLAALRKLASEANSFFADVAGALERRQAQIDLFAVTGPAVELRAALKELSQISASLSGDAKVRIGPAVASIQLDAHVGLIGGPASSMSDTAAAVHARLNSPDLAAALRRLGTALPRLVPAALFDPHLGGSVAGRIAALFDSLDIEPLAREMDDLGDKIQKKFAGMINQVAAGIAKVWTLLLDFASQIMPLGLIGRLHDGMAKIRAELAVLDPSVIEAEVGKVLDSVVSVLNRFSPNSLASQLSGIFDGLKAKLESVNPATLLGNLDPIAGVIAKFETLRPSVVLKPLADSTKDLTKALEELTSLDLGGALVTAAEKLKAQLAVVIEGLEHELQALLDFLEGLAGGGAGVSVSASVG